MHVTYHSLSEIDETTYTATCKNCGPGQKIVPFYDHQGRIFWRCWLAGSVEPKDEWGKIRRLRSRDGGPEIIVPHGVIFALFVRQNGKCAACRQPFTKRMNIDHCHETKKVRGLLCGPCNGAAGQVKDDPGRLRQIAEYLDRFEIPSEQ